jgi:hypothetical protein
MCVYVKSNGEQGLGEVVRERGKAGKGGSEGKGWREERVRGDLKGKGKKQGDGRITLPR